MKVTIVHEADPGTAWGSDAFNVTLDTPISLNHEGVHLGVIYLRSVRYTTDRRKAVLTFEIPHDTPLPD
jgi:hypothetical protein